MWDSFVVYESASCASDPIYMEIWQVDACSSVTNCIATATNSTGRYETYSCWSDERDAAILDSFDGVDFLGLHVYSDSECAEYVGTAVYAANGTCTPSWDDAFGIIATLKNRDDAVIDTYTDTDCEDNHKASPISASQIKDAECVEIKINDVGGYYVVFTSASMDGSASSAASASSSSSLREPPDNDEGLATGAIIAIVAGCVAVVLLIVGLVLCHRHRERKLHSSTGQEALLDNNGLKLSASEDSTAPSSDLPGPRKGTGHVGVSLWDDETIVSWRVPREKVLSTTLISRGGFGEVYKGTYNGQDVAVKMLLPDKRRSHKHVNAFLDEVKMMAALEHSRIVQFIGVAWDSFNDLCVLSEYMAGGDLRALLLHFEETGQPHGFDHDKVKIALHIAHALTYLHSLPQPVIHRDLKSKNVLLTPELDAKLTDFGVSREREDRTMTAGVGTSLWMAPEVMMGDKYGTPADMFSFGVLLSELDLHALPYSHAKENGSTGRKMPDAAILQMVAMGTLSVQFSENSLPEVVELGVSCVSVDPKERLTAAAALYKLQEVLKQL